MVHLSPARYVVQVFGGGSRTAEAIGYTKGAISMWFRPKERRGCNGEVPRAAQKKILEAARQRGLDITERDLIYGRTVPEPARG